MLTQLELGTPIPEELYQTIVDIYAYFLKYTPHKREGAEADRTEEEDAQTNEESGPNGQEETQENIPE